MYAASRGSVAAMRLIIETAQALSTPIDLNSKDTANRTALHFACSAGRHENVFFLLNQPGVDIKAREARTIGGNTPLMCAAQSGNRETIRVCLDKGLNPFQINSFKQKAEDLAEIYKNVDSQDLRNLFENAEQYWRAQLTESEIQEYCDHDPVKLVTEFIYSPLDDRNTENTDEESKQ